MAESPEFLAALEAVVKEDRSKLEQLLDSHPDLVRDTISDERFVAAIVHQLYAGDTLLHVAAAGFRDEIAADLIKSGADVTARNRRGAQPLHYAADANHHDPDAQAATIDVLLTAGADPNAVDKSGTAPLHRAVRTRSSAAVKALLEGAAKVNLKNGSGSTPLFLAHHTTGRGGTGSVEAKAQQADIIRLLLAAGAHA